MTITFETKVWENDWKIMLKTNRIKQMIDRCHHSFDEKILSSTGTQVESNTYSHSANWASTIATFKAASNTAPNIPTLVSPASGSYTTNNKPTLSATEPVNEPRL